MELLKNFFKDKEMHCGGNIPEYILFSKRYLEMLKINICDSVAMVYKALGTAIRIENEDKDDDKEREEFIKKGEFDKDVRLVLNILNKIVPSAGIPKNLAGGTMLIYLELCEGLNFGNI